MRKSIWLRVASVLAVAGPLVLSAGPATAARPAMAYRCTGGDIPSGTYSRVIVTGACQVSTDGSTVIHILGNLRVARGASFDAQSAPSTITVGHNVIAGSRSLLGLGCQPNSAHAEHPCTYVPDGSSTITVRGNVKATNADTVLLNGITVGRNVTLSRGGGDIPWAEKNNVIGGNFSAHGMKPEWFGALFNHVGRNMRLINITSMDPEDPHPVVSVVVNTVGHNLICFGLKPAVSGGFIPGEVNFVGHKALGQCAALV
jgi:hypothetical protein